MAISTVPPAAEDHGDLIPDPVTLADAIELFSQAGYDINESKLNRWIAADRLPVIGGGRGRRLYVSFSDLLEAHNRRHPRGGVQGAQAVP